MGIFDFLDDVQTGAVEAYESVTDSIDGFFGFGDESAPSASGPVQRGNPQKDFTEIERANPQPQAYFAGTQIHPLIVYGGLALLALVVVKKVLR